MNEKNALIISLYDDVAEISQLASSLDYKIIDTIIQHRNHPDANSYIGPGKIEEIQKKIESQEQQIDIIIVDGDLKPSQWFFLEKAFQKDVFDRVRLILALFAERADRKEARLQVELARLQYERPFVRELIHRARAGEHPGFMAGGEYQVDDYYETIKKQTKKIKEDLDKIRDEREMRRKHRHTGGFYLVSLAGYTNAGKSSLLNLLAREKVKVEGRLFSTLSTTTRKISTKEIPILLTDTVGFIQDLPTLIIDAFHSTLEEIAVADVVLLVADASEEKTVVDKKLHVSLRELSEIGVTSPVIIVLNKIDVLTGRELDERITYLKQQETLKHKPLIPVSVAEKQHIDMLLATIHESLPHLTSLTIQLPLTKQVQSFISGVYEKAHVTNIAYNDHVILTVNCSPETYNKIVATCNELKGKIVS
ncbi:MAG: GTPase HflX [Candidatus Thermoplasmatota archaeon]|nr:GTPase HflX [Candidatus Thermoplasmatota archaeon]